MQGLAGSKLYYRGFSTQGVREHSSLYPSKSIHRAYPPPLAVSQILGSRVLVTVYTRPPIQVNQRAARSPRRPQSPACRAAPMSRTDELHLLRAGVRQSSSLGFSPLISFYPESPGQAFSVIIKLFALLFFGGPRVGG